MSDLMQKLAMSKQIMDRHKEIPRGHSAGMPNMVNESIPNAKYNIPQEMVSESVQKPVQMPPQQMDESRILNSKLPEHIKKLMIENPIQQPSFGYFDLISMNLKKLLGKLPGGQSAIASYAAALLLLREYDKKEIKEDFNDYVDMNWLQKEFDSCLAEAEKLFEGWNSDKEQKIQDFASWAIKKLEIKKAPHIKLVAGSGTNALGYFNSETKDIVIAIKNRHQMDIMRTLAHELVHRKQSESGEINGETGSSNENEANALAGVLLRHWGEKNPDHFNEEGEAPTNNVGDGKIAGTVGDPPVYPKNKYKAQNEIDGKAIARRVLGISGVK